MSILGKVFRTLLSCVLLLSSLAAATTARAGVQPAGVVQAPSEINPFAGKPSLVVDNPNAIEWTQYQGDGDEVVEPGETWNISIRLRNTGGSMAKTITSTLSVTSGNAIVLVGSSLYPNIPVGGTGTNTTPFRIKVMTTQPCDSTLGLRFIARYKKGNNTLTYNFTQAVGPAPLDCTVYNTAPVAANDTYLTSISTILNVPAPGVLTNDTDPETDPLTAALVSGTSQGTLTFNPNGSFTYTPVTGYSGDVTFTYQANDGLLNSNTATVTITMTGNQPPVLALIPDQVVNELTLLTFTASATDPEAPPEVLTFSLGSDAPSGAAINPTTGVFTWIPTEMQGPGVYTTTVIVTDSGTPNRSASQAVPITVNEVNAIPVIDPIPTLIIDEQVTLFYTVTVTDSDYPPNSFDFTLDPGAPAGASIDFDTGVFTWTPTEAQGPGDYFITVRVADDGVPPLENTRTFQVTVREVNQAPILATINSQIVNELASLTFTASATDADLPVNTLTYSLVSGAPAGASINSTTGVFTWTPTEAQGPGLYTIGVRVTDNGTPAMYDIKTFQVTVNEVNTPPVLDPIGDHFINGMTTLVFTATASDSDIPANTLTFSLDAGAPAGASINPTTGVFTWTPSAGQVPGDYYPTIRVTDNGSPALNDSETIHIAVVMEPNTAPVLDPIGSKSVDELILLTFTAHGTDGDIPPNTLTYSLEAGAPAGASINSTTGVFTWTPTEAQGPGVYPITVRVTDNGTPSLSDFETIQVTVNEVNTAPVLDPIGNKTVDELILLTFTAHGTDNDIPTNTLTYSLEAGAPAGASINSTTGVFTWTPTEAQGPGVYHITVRVTDNGTPNLNDFETIQVTVNEVNTAPVLSPIGNKSVDELILLTFTAHGTDGDIPPNTLTYSLDAGAPAGASINSTTGVFTWTPTEAQGPGVYPITVRVADNGTPNLSDFETIQVTVNEVNTAPVMDPIGNKTVDELILLTFTAHATDSDIPPNTLTYSLEAGAPAGASINATTGVFTWTPTEAQGPGVYPITVRVTDNGTPSLDDFETIQVTVNEVNLAPVVKAGPDQSANESQMVSFHGSYIDPGLIALEPASINGEIITWSFGDGVTATGTLNPTHTYADNGVYTVNLTVTDTLGATGHDFLLVTVYNIAPALHALPNQQLFIGHTASLNASFTDPGVLDTHIVTIQWEPGQVETIHLAAGVLQFNGSHLYAQAGLYTVTVTVTDADGGQSIQTFQVTVSPYMLFFPVTMKP